MMKIDENTKVIGRFHTKPSPRGLNIYNPFFEEAGINAVYLLFYNPDPKILMDGLRSLGLSGAITVGFETNPDFPKLVDELDRSSTDVGRVGFVVNKGGVVKGYYQGGEGLLRSIKQAAPIEGEEIVIVGAGNVAKSLLFNLSHVKNLPKVTICNRTVKNAERIAKNFNFVKDVFPLEDLSKLGGQILINATDIGGSVADEIFSEKIVGNFTAVSDVTFETEETNLIKLARKFHKAFSTGWDMFTCQGQVVLETILGTEISAEILKKHVIKGLTQVVE